MPTMSLRLVSPKGEIYAVSRLSRICSDANIKPAILLETLIETLLDEDWEIVVNLARDVQQAIESDHMLSASRKLIALDCDTYKSDRTIDILEKYYR